VESHTRDVLFGMVDSHGDEAWPAVTAALTTLMQLPAHALAYVELLRGTRMAARKRATLPVHL
jgi:hypothetical protein